MRALKKAVLTGASLVVTTLLVSANLLSLNRRPKWTVPLLP